MTQIKRPEGKIPPTPEHRATTVRVMRAGSSLKTRIAGPFRRWRFRREAGRKVDNPRRWHRRSYWVMTTAILAGLISVGWFAVGLIAMSLAKPTLIETFCNRGQTCGIVSGFLAPFLALALGTAAFLLWSVWRVRRVILKKARNTARDLVPTAGTIIGEIVGREELCRVIMQALRERNTRHPYLLVGGVGTGKTAVLVRLTELLARDHAVVVPIRLRGVESDLDFGEVAQRQFCDIVDPGTLPAGRAEKVWHQLRKDDLAVVLADGLEEVFPAGSKYEKDRDNLIRRAIQKADEQQLPLVVTSRPQNMLTATTAAIMELEPLSEEAALDYVEQDTRVQDEHRLDWIVETADVAEVPLYLQVTRQLHEHGLLEHLSRRQDDESVDTRASDRSTLRWRLLDTWQTALRHGHLRRELALSPDERKRTIEVVSALACCGLLLDSIEVTFEDLTGSAAKNQAVQTRAANDGQKSGPASTKIPNEIRTLIWNQLKNKILCLAKAADIHYFPSDLSLAATWAGQLGLVEPYGNRVRFPHSILQAYLGSRFLDGLLRDDPDALAEALREPGPGRELLIALVLQSRAGLDGSDMEAGTASNAGAHALVSKLLQAAKERAWGHASRVLVSKLLQAAEAHNEAKAFDIYAAAFEIDSVQHDPIQKDIAQRLSKQWNDVETGDRRTLEEAKLGVVRRFGEALREVATRDHEQAMQAYREFLEIGRKEASYPVRLAVAQEIGSGGDAAFDALCRDFEDPAKKYKEECEEQEKQERTEHAKEMSQIKQRQEDQRRRGFVETESERKRRETCEHEEHKRIVRKSNKARAQIWRECMLRAWLAPLLVASVGEEHREDATRQLRAWLRWLEPEQSNATTQPPISFEIALAQGFKYAANRRRRNPYTCDEARSCLVQYAEELLEHGRYWFTHLTLIQALCLWALPDETSTISPEHRDGRRHRAAASGAKSTARRQPMGMNSGPANRVRHWLAIAGTKCRVDSLSPHDRSSTERLIHPFVARAADLAALALQTAHPEPFIWIDESGTVGKVGSQPAEPTAYRKHNLWIPPSAGWSTLDRRAQQLVADVLVMLNLTEQGGAADSPEAREHRLEHAKRASLPPCLTKDRRPLQPTRTIGWADTAEPGSTCLQGCPFELCPYPPAGAQPRAELTEPFCQRQQALLGRPRLFWRRKTAPWQGMTPRELKSFWTEMAWRTRTPRPED